MLVWMLRFPVLVEVRKPSRSFLVANAVKHANPVATFPVPHKPTCYLLKCPKWMSRLDVQPMLPIDDVNKTPISHALSQVVDPHLRVVSISKVIYALISKKSRINVIGLDVGKALLGNMIVSDTNSCTVISGLLSVRGVGSSLRGWMLWIGIWGVRLVWSVLRLWRKGRGLVGWGIWTVGMIWVVG